MAISSEPLNPHKIIPKPVNHVHALPERAVVMEMRLDALDKSMSKTEARPPKAGFRVLSDSCIGITEPDHVASNAGGIAPITQVDGIRAPRYI
jgi:hypothetical protein